MKREEFISALKEETRGVRVSSGLRRKTLDAAYGKEKMMKKKRIPALALAVVLSIVFCATALALTARVGMLDYWKLFYNKYIPEETDAAIRQNVYATGNDLVNISIRELYYDGLTSRITVDVTAKDERIFLVGLGMAGDDLWKWPNQLNPESDENDTRTVAEVFRQGGYTSSYRVFISLFDPANVTYSGSFDCYYTAPGVLTFFLQESYADDLAERTVEFQMEIEPFLDDEGNQIEVTPENIIRRTEALTLTSSAQDGKMYVNTEPVEFGEIGVTLEQMQLTVKPQELYVKLYYTVHDTELNRRIYSANTLERDQLRLEFTDPSIVTDEPFYQRLAEGPTGAVMWRLLSGEGEMPMRFIDEFTLGLNELSDSYTLRVFDSYTWERYDSAVVTLREATEAAVFPAANHE